MGLLFMGRDVKVFSFPKGMTSDSVTVNGLDQVLSQHVDNPICELAHPTQSTSSHCCWSSGRKVHTVYCQSGGVLGFKSVFPDTIFHV